MTLTKDANSRPSGFALIGVKGPRVRSEGSDPCCGAVSASNFLRTGSREAQGRSVVSPKVHGDRCRAGGADEDELRGVAAAVRYLGKHDRRRRGPVRIGYRKRRQ